MASIYGAEKLFDQTHEPANSWITDRRLSTAVLYFDYKDLALVHAANIFLSN